MSRYGDNDARNDLYNREAREESNRYRNDKKEPTAQPSEQPQAVTYQREPLHIIAIDFDGCIFAGGYPDITKGHVIHSTVVKMHEQMKANPDTEFVLWTCRGGHYLADAIKVVKDNNLPIKYFNEHHPAAHRWFGSDTKSPKIYAHEYWDDKAITVKEQTSFTESETFRSESGDQLTVKRTTSVS